MAFRFFRRLKIAPGISLNFSKSGISASLGRRGARFTVGPRGTRKTVGIPGTGLFYTKADTWGTKRKRRAKRVSGAQGTDQPAEEAPEDRLTLGFLKRLVTPKSEVAFVDGLREFVQGRKAKALKCFGKSDHGDSAFLAGVLSLMLERFEDASRHFLTARSKSGDLGRLFSKYGVLPRCTLDITEQITVDIEPNVRGAQLGLVEAAQRLKKWDVVVQALQHLRRLEPDDPVVKLSLVEAILDAAPANKSIHQRVIRLTKDVDNATPIHTALLLYKARALRALKLTSAAQATLTKAMRRKKNRPADLLRELRYERATLYEDEGQAKRARADLERIYAEAPGFADVAERLGFKAT